MELNFALVRNSVDALLLIVLLLLIVYRKSLSAHINYFIAATLCTVITNVIGKIVMMNGASNNHIVYNIGVFFFTFLFFFIYYYQLLGNKLLKKLQLGIVLIFAAVFLLSAIVIKGFIGSINNAFYFYEIILLLVSIGFFLFETFNSDRILSIKTYFPFWVSISLLVMYVGMMPIILLGIKDFPSISLNVYFTILLAVNTISYSLLITGIFLSKSK